jgi:hypothetical protein
VPHPTVTNRAQRKRRKAPSLEKVMEIMKRNQHVIVKSGEYKGRTGTVDADSVDGVVQVSFDDEAVSHDFMVDELGLID